MVSGGHAFRGSGRIDGASGRARRGGGGIACSAYRIRGASSRIRSGTRSRPRILGPLRWTTSRRRVDFNGEVYVADTEDQSIGLDPSMLCPESEPQVRAIEDVPLVVPETPEADWPTAAKVATHLRLGNSMIHECRRALFNGDTLGSDKLAMEKGEDEETVKSVKKVTAAQEMSISDMETDDENGALAEQEAMEAMAPAPLEEQNATEFVPREFILSMLEVIRSDQMDEHYCRLHLGRHPLPTLPQDTSTSANKKVPRSYQKDQH